MEMDSENIGIMSYIFNTIDNWTTNEFSSFYNYKVEQTQANELFKFEVFYCLSLVSIVFQCLTGRNNGRGPNRCREIKREYHYKFLLHNKINPKSEQGINSGVKFDNRFYEYMNTIREYSNLSDNFVDYCIETMNHLSYFGAFSDSERKIVLVAKKVFESTNRETTVYDEAVNLLEHQFFRTFPGRIIQKALYWSEINTSQFCDKPFDEEEKAIFSFEIYALLSAVNIVAFCTKAKYYDDPRTIITHYFDDYFFDREVNISENNRSLMENLFLKRVYEYYGILARCGNIAEHFKTAAELTHDRCFKHINSSLNKKVVSDKEKTIFQNMYIFKDIRDL